MNLHMYDMVYSGLTAFLKQKSKFEIFTYNLPSGDSDYPKVIFQEISNTSIAVSDPHSLHGFEINIYAKDTGFEGDWITSIEVARYLQGIVDEYLSSVMRFKRVMAMPTPNIDNNIYRITMQYTAKSSDSRSCFF